MNIFIVLVLSTLYFAFASISSFIGVCASIKNKSSGPVIIDTSVGGGVLALDEVKGNKYTNNAS